MDALSSIIYVRKELCGQANKNEHATSGQTLKTKLVVN